MKKIFMGALLATTLLFAEEEKTPTVSFSGYIDADFATGFSEDLKDPSHTSGLEMDLTTTIQFADNVTGILYTTANDGVIPAQGAGVWWPSVNFDGAYVAWAMNENVTLNFGDLIYGVGYFNYYLYKRTAVVVGEHAVRGFGIETNGLTISTGMAGDVDGDAANGAEAWSTFIMYDVPLGVDGMSLVPTLKYTAGIPNATPLVAGLDFNGTFGPVDLHAAAAFNMYGDVAGVSTDPGFTILVEPSIASGNFSVAGSFFMNVDGEDGVDPIAPNGPVGTLGNTLDEMFIYVEPGISFNDNFAFGLPIEWHDTDMDADDDEGFWLVPTFYIYPASNVEVWTWGQVIFPSASDADPEYYAGSEIILSF